MHLNLIRFTRTVAARALACAGHAALNLADRLAERRHVDRDADPEDPSVRIVPRSCRE